MGLIFSVSSPLGVWLLAMCLVISVVSGGVGIVIVEGGSQGTGS